MGLGTPRGAARRALARLAFAAAVAGACRPAPDPAQRVREEFPGHAARVLGGSGVATPARASTGYALDRAGGAAPFVEELLPFDGADPVRFELAGGFSVRVRAAGAGGAARVEQGAVVYARAGGGASFWSAIENGLEEWVYLPDVRGRTTLEWALEGGRWVASGDSVYVVDERGRPRMEVLAREAWGSGGRLPTLVSVAGDRLRVSVEANGPVLIDPAWIVFKVADASPRYLHAAALMTNEYALSFGGTTDGVSALGTGDIYDPSPPPGGVETPTGDPPGWWLHTPALPAGTPPRWGHSATALSGDRVLIAGGKNPGRSPPVLGDCVVFTFAEPMSWQPCAAGMAQARHGAVAVSLDPDRVLVIGGIGWQGGREVPLATVELFDARTLTFVSLGSLTSPRHSFAATVVPANVPGFAGQVLISGGYSTLPAGPPLATVELFDPVARASSPAGALGTARALHTVTATRTGRFFVFGGLDSAGLALAAPELLDLSGGTPSISTRLAPALMPPARAEHTATLTRSGHVALAFGADGRLGITHLQLVDAETGEQVYEHQGYNSAERVGHAAFWVDHTYPGVMIVGGKQPGSARPVSQYVAFQYSPDEPWEGATCTSGVTCSTGFCVDGYCCDTACGGGVSTDCLVCNVLNSEGTCAPLAAATACDDGFACTSSDQCGADGVCRGTQAGCPVVASCGPATVGMPCDDGIDCNSQDVCGADRVCRGMPVYCVPLLTCEGQPPGASCDDGFACTSDDRCGTDLVCRGAPVNCPVVASCAPATVGMPCDDGVACTSGDVCTPGDLCRGTPVDCPPIDVCVGLADGSPCDDGDLCTQADACRSGICRGNAYGCGAPGPCVATLTCDGQGGCTPTPKPDRSVCDDVDPCTSGDQCTAGICGGTPYTCRALGECETALTCDGQGGCTPTAKPDRSPCNDGDPCTSGDQCTAGSCAGTAYTCRAPAECEAALTCDGQGGCALTAKPDQSPCDDLDPCTRDDGCTSGICAGTPYTCPASTDCADFACDGTGACPAAPRADGDPCSDGSVCTEGDGCRAGVCVPGAALACEALECHEPARCDSELGCPSSTPSAPDGVRCGVGLCLQGGCAPLGLTVVLSPRGEAAHPAGSATATITLEEPATPVEGLQLVLTPAELRVLAVTANGSPLQPQRGGYALPPGGPGAPVTVQVTVLVTGEAYRFARLTAEVSDASGTLAGPEADELRIEPGTLTLGGCGCTSAAGAAPWGGLASLLLWLRSRRVRSRTQGPRA